MSNQQNHTTSSSSSGWKYYEAGKDTLNEVPPVGDDKELQNLFETLRDDAEGDARGAYDDAARLVEAHRIQNLHEMIRSRRDIVGTYAGTLSLILAMFAGVIVPLPNVPENTGVAGVFSEVWQTLMTLESLLAGLLFAVAILIQTYAQYRSMGEKYV